MVQKQGQPTIQVGQTIAHYKILSWIAGSGSGELYRAEDLRARRTVALRVVPADVIADPEERELPWSDAEPSHLIPGDGEADIVS